VRPTTIANPLNLGFLTILHEASGYLGGYLVTNAWGRPLEFRLSTAVQPNRVQQILYADTLEAYLGADLIGKTLVEKTGTAVQLLMTDCRSVLDLRRSLDVPVAWLPPPGEASRATAPEVRPEAAGKGSVRSHPGFPEDVARIQELLEKLDDALDLAEPFSRIREAVGEARKQGGTARG
jgi:hypothetical protein